MADGHNVRPLDTIKLPLLIDNQYIYQIFVVADIDIPVVLGYDFMYNNQCVIDVPNKNLLLNSQTVDCHLESQIPSLFKISIDKQVTIPPNSETIIHALPNEKLPYGTTMILDNTTRPLHRLTEKNVIFKWNAECETAFNVLKKALITSPILTYPCIDKEFILDTDASGTGVGAVLSQINDEGKECVIAYFSRTLSRTERQYCVTRRELLAIVLAVKHFHHYLYGVKFTVRTDHGALNWLKNFKNPEGQLARWLEILGTYTFIIKHRAGLKHGNADGLSRRPCVNCKQCDTRDVTENFDLEKVIRKPKYRNFHLSQHHKTYWSQWDRLTVVDGILYRKWENTTTNDINLQYVLPSADRNRGVATVT
ncbi:unnamed protein product [Mytilus coruscus]|uniref:Reverse transcriptase/retrotransposon-derived protein RNase H-like domain-containing protein n=1 Tax=Mytilus coruscus TaxID=42192 RepID=A0A6J8CAI0_MYTCO|nr:unnamed protein product [Mytilus coruscus]